MTLKARPQLERLLNEASAAECIKVDEFLALLQGNGDSSSLFDVLWVCCDKAGIRQVRAVVDDISAIGGVKP